MIAKIDRGKHLYGALAYNQTKVNKGTGAILLLHNMQETPDGKYSVQKLWRSFETNLAANRNTEKPVLHISLNPDPKDHVSDEQFREMAQQYMREMGYGHQPFVVFKHTDVERTHIHIVSVCVDEAGKKISDAFERRRSMDVCRKLEGQYQLIAATEKQQANHDPIFQPVNYVAGDIKSQLAAVIRHLPKYYQFQSLGAYNALLSLYNIRVEEVKGEIQGQPKRGLVYFALNEQGEKVTNPFKSSLFGKAAGISALEKHFTSSKDQMKTNPAKVTLQNSIEAVLSKNAGETEFTKELLAQGINTVVRRNEQGSIYGITFIDHRSRTVWNGSQLGKNFSANHFNELWKEHIAVQQLNNGGVHAAPFSTSNPTVKNQGSETAHPLFDFLSSSQLYPGGTGNAVIDVFGDLLSGNQVEDYEELAFASRMKKRKKISKTL